MLSLVLMLVVFAILALVVGLAPPALEKMRESSQYRSTLRSLAAELRAARSDPAAYAKSYSEALQVMDAKTLEGMGFKAPAGTKQGAAPAPGRWRDARRHCAARR